MSVTGEAAMCPIAQPDRTATSDRVRAPASRRASMIAGSRPSDCSIPSNAAAVSERISPASPPSAASGRITGSPRAPPSFLSGA
ncbi:hypothetical protein [Corynebacterium kalidii]